MEGPDNKMPKNALDCVVHIWAILFGTNGSGFIEESKKDIKELETRLSDMDGEMKVLKMQIKRMEESKSTALVTPPVTPPSTNLVKAKDLVYIILALISIILGLLKIKPP